jgi:hypothetical protein
LFKWDKSGHFIPIKVAMWLMLLHRNLKTYDYWSTTHNSQAMETTKMPQYWRIKKMWYLYTWNFMQPQRMKFCHSQVNGWNWRV